MKIKVNGQAVEIFSGARVKDAVRKSSPSAWALVRKKDKAVFDRSAMKSRSMESWPKARN